MPLAFVVNRIKSLVLLLFGLVKRALCCFSRRRRKSFDSVPLTTVGVVPNSTNETSCPELQSWNSWDDSPVSVVSDRVKPNSVQQHIEMYRQKSRLGSDSECEVQPDYFEDMAPKITKQLRIVLKPDRTEQSPQGGESFSRLSLGVDAVSYSSPDLETWEDTPGWEDDTQEDFDPNEIVKEQRRLERQRRHEELLQKKQEKEPIKLGKPLALGAKLS